jgi:hypothetical protein
VGAIVCGGNTDPADLEAGTAGAVRAAR